MKNAELVLLDKRDLVKWSVLVRLAEQYELSRIIQIAYLRPADPASLMSTVNSQNCLGKYSPISGTSTTLLQCARRIRSASLIVC